MRGDADSTSSCTLTMNTRSPSSSAARTDAGSRKTATTTSAPGARARERRRARTAFALRCRARVAWRSYIRPTLPVAPATTILDIRVTVQPVSPSTTRAGQRPGGSPHRRTEPPARAPPWSGRAARGRDNTQRRPEREARDDRRAEQGEGLGRRSRHGQLVDEPVGRRECRHNGMPAISMSAHITRIEGARAVEPERASARRAPAQSAPPARAMAGASRPRGLPRAIRARSRRARSRPARATHAPHRRPASRPRPRRRPRPSGTWTASRCAPLRSPAHQRAREAGAITRRRALRAGARTRWCRSRRRPKPRAPQPTATPGPRCLRR